MKKTILFLTLAVIGFASCKKGDTIYTSPIVPPYHVDGVRDITLQKSNSFNAYATLDLSIAYENSDQERISLSLEGAPRGLYASFSDTIGYPSFTSQLYLRDSNVAAGRYALKLVSTGSISGRKEFTFNVNVVAAPVTNIFLADTGYNSYTSCGGSNFIQNITAVAGTSGRILFSNFDNSGNQVEATVDGDSTGGYIFIPTQTVNGVTYSSSSSSSNYYNISGGSRNIRVMFIKSSGGSSNSCTLYLNK